MKRISGSIRRLFTASSRFLVLGWVETMMGQRYRRAMALSESMRSLKLTSESMFSSRCALKTKYFPLARRSLLRTSDLRIFGM